MSHVPALSHLFNLPRAQWPSTILEAITQLYCAIFPERIRAVYVMGSYAENSAASVSDVDAAIIFKESFIDDSEEGLAQRVMEHCRLLSPLRLDVGVVAEDDARLRTGVDVRLKLGSQLLYGEDIRNAIPLPSIDAYRDHMRNWTAYFLKALHDVEELRFPLAYPDPNDRFFGYTRLRAKPWYPAGVESGTKELVATVCWTATGLLAFEAGHFVGTRAECIRTSRKLLAPEWGELVGETYQKCKQEWDYEVPAREEERLILRQICEQARRFFNFYGEKVG